jgi:hypothetical protein
VPGHLNPDPLVYDTGSPWMAWYYCWNLQSCKEIKNLANENVKDLNVLPVQLYPTFDGLYSYNDTAKFVIIIKRFRNNIEEIITSVGVHLAFFYVWMYTLQSFLSPRLLLMLVAIHDVIEGFSYIHTVVKKIPR